MITVVLLALLTLVLAAACIAGVWTMRISVPLGTIITMASAFGIYAAWAVHINHGRRRVPAHEEVAKAAPAVRRPCLDEIRTPAGTICRR